MNMKKWIIASLVVFVTFELTNFLIHSFVLSGCYDVTASLWRPNMMEVMWLMTLSDLLFSFVFVYVFQKGYEGKGVLEGIRFGCVISLLMIIPGLINQYVVYPIPDSLLIRWLLTGIPQILICGMVAALIYKPKSK